MDNICHTLVGAALAESGLKRRTALGTATLIIGVNFPDIDVVSVATGHGLGFRRGITHGIPALIVLPFVLAALMVGWHRLRRREGPPPDPGQLLLLSAVSIASHPVLDWMNTYGTRWLLPFDGTWSYGDTLFIVDPWLWIALGVGVIWTRRRWRANRPAAKQPARVALIASAVYILAMALSTRQARRVVSGELRARGVMNVVTLVVDPVPLNPLRRRVIYESSGAYHFAEFRWLPPRLSQPYHEIQVSDGSARVAVATMTRQGREFLSWSRLPFFAVDTTGGGTTVFMGDARYTLGMGPSWASARVDIP